MKRLLLLAPLFWAGSSAARACVGCAESVSVANGRPAEILAGFSVSVLFMLGAVLFTVGGLTSLVVRACGEIEAARKPIPIPVSVRESQDRLPRA